MEKINQNIKHRYELLKKIGMGAYGQVWKARDKFNKNRIVAIKRIYDAFRNKTDAQRTYRQICYHSIMKHPNLVKFFSLHQFDDDKDIYLSLQYMQMDLAIFLKQNTLTQTHKLYIFYQIINAISYFHASDLIHRDLKPSNILLNKNCQAKICDFGLLRSVNQKRSFQPLQMTQNIATKFYQAPQILLGSKFYGKPIDIWSLGCILAEMMTGKTLFSGSSVIDFLESIVKICGKPSQQDINSMTQSETSRKIIQQITVNQQLKLQSVLNCSNKHLIQLLSRMLEFNPQKRITIQEIKGHPLFKKFRNTVHEVTVTKPILIPYDKKEALQIKTYQELIKKFSVPIQRQQLANPQHITQNLSFINDTPRSNKFSFLNSVKNQTNQQNLIFFPGRIGVSKSPKKQQQSKNEQHKKIAGYALSSLNTTEENDWSKKKLRSQIMQPQFFLNQIKQQNYMVNSVTSFTNYKRKQQLAFSPLLQYHHLNPQKKGIDNKNVSFELRWKSEQ